MPVIHEVLTDWNVANTPGGTTVQYYSTAETADTAREAWSDYLQAIKGELVTSCSWSIRTEGRDIESTTGELVDMWNDPTALTGNGLANSQPVANAAQVLLRWSTGVVVDGRMIRGKTYIPGLSMASTSGGEIPAGPRSTFTVPMTAFLTTPPILVIWHRPKKATETSPARVGADAVVASGSVWQELAIQRRRR